jgi:hypothetical protein
MNDDILGFFDGTIEVGQSWGVRKLDEHYPFKHNFGIHCGAAGSGKTDILLSMHFSQAIRNKAQCIAYLDEGSQRMHYLRIIGQLYGKKLFEIYPFETDPKKRTKWYVSRDELIAGYEEVVKYVKIIDKDNDVLRNEKTISTLLNVFRGISSKGNVQSVLIDPKNAFSVDNKKGQHGAYEYDKVILDEMRVFQQDLNVKLDLVVHPSKGARMTKHTEADKVRGIGVGGQSKPVDIWDAENGAVIEARADDSLTFHRYRKVAELETYTLLSVRKIKEEETGGKTTDDDSPIWVYKDKRTWRWMFDETDLLGSVLAHKPIEQGSVASDLPF